MCGFKELYEMNVFFLNRKTLKGLFSPKNYFKSNSNISIPNLHDITDIFEISCFGRTFSIIPYIIFGSFKCF